MARLTSALFRIEYHSSGAGHPRVDASTNTAGFVPKFVRPPTIPPGGQVVTSTPAFVLFVVLQTVAMVFLDFALTRAGPMLFQAHRLPSISSQSHLNHNHLSLYDFFLNRLASEQRVRAATTAPVHHRAIGKDNGACCQVLQMDDNGCRCWVAACMGGQRRR